jgi:hypothetical protein
MFSGSLRLHLFVLLACLLVGLFVSLVVSLFVSYCAQLFAYRVDGFVFFLGWSVSWCIGVLSWLVGGLLQGLSEIISCNYRHCVSVCFSLKLCFK